MIVFKSRYTIGIQMISYLKKRLKEFSPLNVFLFTELREGLLLDIS